MAFDEFVGEFEECVLALGEGADEDFSVADLIAEVGAGFGVVGGCHEVFVGVADGDVWDVFVGEGGLPVSVEVLFYDDVGSDVGI